MELRQGIEVTADTSDAEAGLNRVGKAARGAGDDIQKAGSQAAGASGGFGQMERGLNSLERQIIRMAGAWLVYKGAFAGLEGADQIQDLQKQIDNLTGSIGDGAKAMAFFQSVQDRTRATTTELMKVYEALAASNLGPGGFANTQDLQKFSVELVNAGTAAGISTPKMLAFWEAVKRGEGARFDKDTMSKLGLNNDDVKNLDLVAAKIEDLSKKGETMGLTFQTALAKIGDAWVMAFAGGTGDKQAAYQELFKQLTDPAILDAIRNIATGIIEIIKIVPQAAAAAIQPLRFVLDAMIAGIAIIMEKVSGFIQEIFTRMKDATPSYLPGLADILGKGANAAQGVNDFSVGLKSEMMQGMTGAADTLAKAFSGVSDSTNKFTGALATNATGLQTNKDKTAELEKAAKKLLDQQNAGVRADAAFQQLQTRVDSVFNIDEGESPFDKKIKSLEKSADEFTTTLEKDMAEAANYINYGNQTGKADVVATWLARWQQYSDLLDSIKPKLAAAVSAEAFNQAQKEAQGFLDIIRQLDDAARSLTDSMKNALSSFANPDINGFATNIANGIPQIIAEMDAAVTDIMNRPTTDTYSAAQRMKDAEEAKKTYADIGQQFIKDNETAAKKWADGFTTPLTTIFTDLATNGGKNFGQIAGQMFTAEVSKGMSKLSDVIGNVVLDAFGGGPLVAKDQYNPDQHGGKPYEQYVQDSQQQQQAIMGVFQGVVGALGQTITMFQNAAKGQQTSVVGSTVSMAAVGAAIGTEIAPGLGTIIGALVGALVGGIMASIANAEAKKKLPYGQYGIDASGNPYLNAYDGGSTGDKSLAANFQNINSKDYNDMMNRMASAINDTVSGFIQLMTKFPAQMLQGLTLGIGEGFKPDQALTGDFLQNFTADFNNWVDNVLPTEVAQRFQDQVGTLFEGMGMTADRFNGLWAKLQGMDPKAALQVLNDTADAIIAFQKVMTYAKGIQTSFNAAFAGGMSINTTDNLGSVQHVSAFDQSVQDANTNLQSLSTQVQHLPFADAAAAAAKMGKGLEDLQTNLTTFLNHVLDISKQLHQSLSDDIFNAKVQNAPDNAAKEKLYQDRYNQDIYQANHWKELGLTPDEVQSRINDAASQATAIYNLDPKGRQAWYEQQLTQLDSDQQKLFKAIGDDAIAQTNAIVASFQPVIDWFNGLPGQASVGGAMTAVAAAATGAAAAINLLTASIPGGAAAASNAASETPAAAAANNSQDAANMSISPAGANTNVRIQVSDPTGFVQNVRASRMAR